MSKPLPTALLTPPSTVVKFDKENFKVINKKPLIDECLWALQFPELQKACFLARICAKNPPVACKFYNIGSILQVGPTCGLTALRMLLGGLPPADQLLLEAQQKNFTNNGEMFSAFNLYKLICDNIPVLNNNNISSQQNTINANGTVADKQQMSTTKYTNIIECQMHEGLLNCVKVKESLQNGACMFVPYPF